MRAFLARPTSARPGSVVGTTYSLPLSSVGEERVVEEEKRRLTLQARSSFGRPPPAFEAWSVTDDGILHVPRFYGLSRFGPAETDARVEGDPVSLRFVGTPTAHQARAAEVVFRSHLSERGDGGAIVCLPCGYGKTVWAVQVACRLGRKTCVFVHKSFLRDQWVEAFRTFCPEARVGFIQGKTWDVEDKDVVVAMVMTIAKRKFDPDLTDSFGLLLFDECHHLAAPVMNAATELFRARYVVGLTATKDRADGLTPLLHWSIGPEAFSVQRDDEKVRVSVALYAGGTKEKLSRDGKPLVSVMVNCLAANRERNAFLGRRIAAMRAEGRVVIVLSDRISQLTFLRSFLDEVAGLPPDEIGFFTGSTKAADRPVQIAKPVLLCSYGMANEGLDKREADACVMATPKGNVVQCIGRIQRPCPTKGVPLVLDVADDDVPFFRTMRWKRQRLYAKEGYEVQVLPASSPEEAWSR